MKSFSGLPLLGFNCFLACMFASGSTSNRPYILTLFTLPVFIKCFKWFRLIPNFSANSF